VAEWAAVDEESDRTRPLAASGGVASSFNAQQLADAAGGELIAAGSAPISGAAVDSRRVKPGNVFFALPGERSDGHHFLEAAAAAGAGALVVTEPLPEERLHALASNGRVSIVRVADAGAALRSTAARYRDRFDPLVVGITGSIAKTSTKEQVAEVLDERFTVLRNPANWNNEIGLPMTLLQLRPEHEVAVLEMGLYTTGEIAMLAGLARPSVGVVTAVRGVHLSRAGSIDAIEAGKRELVEALPASGWAVLNADDERVRRMAGHTSAQVLTYGLSPAADIGAQDIESRGAAGMRYSLCLPDGTWNVTSPVLGRHGVHNALAAAAVASCIGMDAGRSRAASAWTPRPSSRACGASCTCHIARSWSELAAGPSLMTPTTHLPTLSWRLWASSQSCQDGASRCLARCSSWVMTPRLNTSGWAGTRRRLRTVSSSSAKGRGASSQAPWRPARTPLTWSLSMIGTRRWHFCWLSSVMATPSW